jgi:uncharacterized membrane protein YciS (DUF1049 family)
MSNNIEFKDLWQKKTSEPPNLSEVYALANKAKKQLFIKTILINIIFGLTAAFIITIWVYYKPQLLTTKIGICLTILAISSFILAQNSILPFLKKEKDNFNLNDYLLQLKNIRKKEMFMQTTMMNIYFILLSLGILLYMYEYVEKTFLSIIFAYGITILWFAFNWFYLRPKTIKKQQEKSNLLITKFENLQKQLTEQ